MKGILRNTMILFAIILTGCNSSKSTDAPLKIEESLKEANQATVKNLISIFEIPATDFTRATTFYESILDIKIEKMDMYGMQMGLLTSAAQTVSGMIIKGDGYLPSSDGVVIYLNGGDNFQSILDKMEVNGGQIIVPKTLIDEENGYFAMFLDTEGNRLGLHSPN